MRVPTSDSSSIATPLHVGESDKTPSELNWKNRHSLDEIDLLVERKLGVCTQHISFLPLFFKKMPIYSSYAKIESKLFSIRRN